MLNSKTFKRCLVLITSLGLIAGLTACGRGHGHGHGPRMGMLFEVVSNKLEFNEQQEAIMNQIQDELKAIKDQHDRQHGNRHTEFVALIEAEQLDNDKIQSIIDEQKQSFETFSPRVLPLLSELHATLTVEQKDKIIAFANKRHKRRS